MKFQLTATEIAIILSVVIPGIVALLTKSTASPKVKQIVNIALAAVGGWVATAVSESPYNLRTVLITIGKTFIFSVASYFGLKSFVATPVESATGTKGLG